jgi:hypothetical protein
MIGGGLEFYDLLIKEKLIVNWEYFGSVENLQERNDKAATIRERL